MPVGAVQIPDYPEVAIGIRAGGSHSQHTAGLNKQIAYCVEELQWLGYAHAIGPKFRHPLRRHAESIYVGVLRDRKAADNGNRTSYSARGVAQARASSNLVNPRVIGGAANFTRSVEQRPFAAIPSQAVFHPPTRIQRCDPYSAGDQSFGLPALLEGAI